jgi:unsaturated rhamnogalacturonyl hydrolase
MKPDVKELVARVIRYTAEHPFEHDTWERAMAISGVLLWDDEAAIREMQRWVDRVVALQGTNGYLSYDERIELTVGHVKVFTPSAALTAAFGFPVLQFYERTGEERYLNAARRHADVLLSEPRTRDGGISVTKDGLHLYIDFLYLMCPMLVKLGKITGERKYIDEAVKQIEVVCHHLWDNDCHLTRHAWSETPNMYLQSTFWSRGNGWLVCCIVELMDMIPDHPKAARLREICAKTLTAMKSYQDDNGYLRVILDDPQARFETSGTIMFAYGAARAVQQGIVAEEFSDAAWRAFLIVAGSVEADGGVPGVQIPPGGPGVPFGITHYGQGFFLQAAHALRDRWNGK